MTLPVLNCDSCGACCMHVGTPPLMGEEYDALPKALRDEIDHHQKIDPWRCDSGRPCLWFDEATRRCKHYERRPEICKEFEVGDEDCLRIREERGI